MNLKSLLTNRLATQTFIILLIGFIFIHISALFIYNAYWKLEHKRLSPNKLANEVVRIVALAKVLPPNELRRVLRDVRHAGVHVRFHRRPVKGMMELVVYDPKQIREKILKNPNNFEFNYPLNHNIWLTVRTRIYKPRWLIIEFLITAIFIVLTSLLLIGWAVNRLAVPLDRFNRAVKRLATDIKAPPLSESGPKPIREISQAFNRMQSQMQSLISNRTQMLAAISHDLRTPITRLKLRSENIENQQQAEKMNRDLTEMDTMITSILTFAKDQVYGEPVENFDLEALLTTLSDDLIDTGYQVNYHSYGKRLIYRGRLLPLKRALNNLIENAVKYGKQADVYLTRNDQAISIKINDQGPGIPEDELDKVFLPFYRVDKARSPKKPGTGLGLAVTQDIIKAHGGDITLRNLSPHGLSVRVTLPS